MRNLIQLWGAGLLFAQANLAMFEPDRSVEFFLFSPPLHQVQWFNAVIKLKISRLHGENKRG